MISESIRHIDGGHFQIQDLLEKVVGGGSLDPIEQVYLLSQEDPQVRKEIGLTAGKVKEWHFGKRVLIFCPLYLSNDCVNNCLYCGFRRDNSSAVRRTLTVKEAAMEARILAERRFRQILLVAGEHPTKVSTRYLCQVVEAILQETPIKGIAVSAAPIRVKDFRALKESGASAYQCFQETYQQRVYGLMHPPGKKRDYAWRVGALDRAIAAGFQRVGMGILLGLSDFRSDVLDLVAHARGLLGRYKNLDVVLSLPRFRPAIGAPLTKAPFPVSDEDYAHAVAVCRLSLPLAEIAISTRERPEFREALMDRGGSMMSAGSVTWPGGYTADSESQMNGQFIIEDTRSVEQVHRALIDRKSTRLNSSHTDISRMPSSA